MTRVGFPCFMCGLANATGQGKGNIVEGLPLNSRTPGDCVFCAQCLEEIAEMICAKREDERCMCPREVTQ